MPKTTAKEKEIENIRDDVQSLKTNILALSKQIEADGKMTAAELRAKAHENFDQLKGRAQENIANFQDYSKDQLRNVEAEIKKNPVKSMAIAFGTGILLSALFRKGK